MSGPRHAPRKQATGLEALLAEIQFDEQGLVPAVIQDATTRQVLTLCYLNQDALARSLERGKVYVFRRSQQRLMLKGETSGHIQRIKRVSVDCEGKSLLLEVEQRVACCHTGYFSCYYRRVNARGVLTVRERRVFDPIKVYHRT
jgi:phosphoribosyl-AMP cyclohydrolase